MRQDRKKLEDFYIGRREFKIYWYGIEPYPECVCRKHAFEKPFRWLIYRRYKKRKLKPYHNKAGNCRYGNSHKSWKNYRKTQYRPV